MKSSRSFVLGAVLVTALLGGSGVTWATTSAPNQAAPAPAKPAAAGTASASNYVPITPCREVDTRYALTPGPISAGATREFDFTGKPDELAQQGGQYGCTIGSAATAIQVTITATGAAGSGNLAAWDLNASAPGTQVLSYGPIGDSTTSATIATSSGAIQVEPRGAGTNLIIDVEGYYTAPPAQPEMLTASVGYGGFLGVNTHVTNLVDAGGQYQITFDRDITACTFQATASGKAAYLNEFEPYAPNGVTNTLLVEWQFDSGAGEADPAFAVTGTCTS